MGLSHAPRVITDGLTLALDAAPNPRFSNYKGRSVTFSSSDDDGFNVSNSTGWFNPNNTSQWTLEGWILNPSSTNIFSIYSGTNNSIANFGCSIGGSVAFQSGNGAWSWVTNSTIVADTGSPTGWNHFAFTKNGSTFEVFLNGSRIYTGTPTFGTGGTGGSIHLQSYFSDGNYYQTSEGLSNVRYVTGSVLYSGTSYTVPTKPFTATGGGTQLLIYQGNTFTDASSNNLTLTKQNSPTANLGSPASAFEFDGTDDHVTIGNTLTDADELFADTGRAWSASSWFNPDDDDAQAVISRGGLGNSGTNFLIWVNNGKLRVRLRGGTTTDLSTSIAANTWYNVAVTWDGSTANGYLNGQFVSTIPVATASLQSTRFGIGNAGADMDRERFDGKISQVLAYNRALTASEVLQNYNALKGRYE